MQLTRRGVLAGAAALAAAPSTAQAQRLRWIDVHMHTLGGPERQFGQAVASAIADMDRRGIDKAVIFPPPFPQRGYDYPAYVGELRRYPGRFGFLGGGGFLNPMLHQFPNPAEVTPEFKQQFIDLAEKMADAGAVGFGEIAVLHLSLVPKHAFEETAPEHPLMLALVEVAGRRGLVIDLHMDAVAEPESLKTPSFLRSPLNPPRLKGNIAAFERLLAHERNARIVWAHGGSDFTGHMTPALIGRLMDAHPNLFMSLRPIGAGMREAPAFGLRFSNTIMPGEGVDKAWLGLLQRHSDRFVLGADAFHIAPSVPEDHPIRKLGRGNDVRLSAAAQLLARLPAPLIAKIARENATRLYKL